MKRFLALALSLCLMLSLSMPTAWAIEFSDMPDADHWSYTALEAAVENGLLNGADGKLMPGSALTRAQMAAIINRAFGAMDMADIGSFSDVKTTDWFFTDIAKAVRMGTFRGDESGLMNPDSPITREQAFTVLARAFRLEDGSAEALTAFADAEKISGYAVGPVAALVAAGYVNGSNGRLNPGSTISRAEFAQVIYNMIRHYIAEEGTYTEDYSGNVMVNVPGVILKDLTIEGDLIIGEGVGNGEVTLDGVALKGRLLVRGGGENSIVIKNKTSVGHVILSKTGDGGVRLYTEEGCRVDVVYIPDGKDDIILEGTFNQVAVDTDAPIVLKSASITGLTVTGENADIQTQGHTEITTVVIGEEAAGATLTVDGSSTVTNLESAAENVTVDGKGTVVQANISGDNTAVNTKGTKVTTGEDTTGVTVGGEEIESGTTVDPGTPSTPVIPDIPSIPEIPEAPEAPENPEEPEADKIEVSTLEELKAALGKSYKVITITGTITAEKEKLVVAEGQTLVITSALTLDKKSTLTVDGKLVNYSFLDLKGGSELIVNGILHNVEEENGRQHLDTDNSTITVSEGAEVVNTGILRMNNGSALTVSGTFTSSASDDRYYRVWVTDSSVAVEKSGIYQNLAATYLTDSTLTVDGTFVNGYVSEDGGVWNRLYAVGSDITVNGTFTNMESIRSYNDEENPAASSLTVNGVFNNKGGVYMEEDAVITISGTFENAENARVNMWSAEIVVEKDGLFNSYGSFNLYGGSLTNDGVFNNGKASQTGTTWLRMYLSGAEFVNNGTFVNEMGIRCREYEEDGEILSYPEFTNYGKFVNGSLQNSDAGVYMENGTFRSCGHFVSNGMLSFTYSDFSHKGNEMFESSDGLYLVGGSFDVSKANAGTFKNTGWMTIVDEYGEVDNICEINLGKRDAFHNDTCFLWYRVDVTSAEGMRRAEEAQLAKLAEAEGEPSYFGFDAYDTISINDDINITEDTTLEAFGNYQIQGTWMWDSELQQQVLIPATLSVASGVTLTLKDTSLYVSSGGCIANDGCITTVDDGYYYGQIEVGDGGSYSGDGKVSCDFFIQWYEGRLHDTALKDYQSYTVLVDGDNVYTVDQDTDISSVYSITDDTEIVVIGRNGSLSGSALAQAKNRVYVESFPGLKGAMKMDMGDQIVDCVYITGDDRLTVTEDLVLERRVNIFSNTGLIIPYGVTLTVGDYLYNSGDISVDGTLVIAESGRMYNHRNLEVGALLGDETGEIIVYGRLYNWGYIHIYATGRLIDGGNGRFINDGELDEDEGSENDFE